MTGLDLHRYAVGRLRDCIPDGTIPSAPGDGEDPSRDERTGRSAWAIEAVAAVSGLVDVGIDSDLVADAIASVVVSIGLSLDPPRCGYVPGSGLAAIALYVEHGRDSLKVFRHVATEAEARALVRFVLFTRGAVALGIMSAAQSLLAGDLTA